MKDERNLLVVDDEEDMLVSYQKILGREGFQVSGFQSARGALERLEASDGCSLVICDLKMPDMDGMAFLSAVKKDHAHLPVIMVTGYGTLESAFEAVRIGAFDFLEKPFSSKKLLESVNKALAICSTENGSNAKDNELDGMMGRHPSMRRLFNIIPRISQGDANVLVTGESGVGKELVARSIHKRSMRRNRPLIPVNCGALPESLFESEVFGYQKGAFTGAHESKPGLVELAHGGTLFLDEVCEMSQGLQVKLLRMLEGRKIRRVGGKAEIDVDVRIVSATNRDVDELLESRALREDFFYRINTIHLVIPPLRERADDIPLLARHFLREFNVKYDRRIDGFEPAALEVMKSYKWPGNVRELQNVIERTYYLANPPLIRCSDLPTFLTAPSCAPGPNGDYYDLSYREAKDRAIEAFERDYILHYLQAHDWNISQAANACGVDRRTLHRLINRFDLRED